MTVSDCRVLDTLFQRSHQLNIPVKASIELTTACNLDCRHCLNQPRQLRELSSQEWMQILEQAASLGVLELTFTGGEPSVRPDLFDIVARARQLRFHVTIISNLVSFADDQLAALVDIGVMDFRTSLYSDVAEEHDEITGAPGSFAATLASVRCLLALGARVIVQTVLLAPTVHRLPQLARFARSLGAGFLFTPYLAPPEASGAGAHPLTVSPQALAQAVPADSADFQLLQLDQLLQRPAYQASDVLCSAGRSLFHLDAHGQFYPCYLWARPQGSVLKMSLSELWNGGRDMEGLREMTFGDLACANCPDAQRCSPCMGDNVSHTGDPTTPSPIRCGVAATFSQAYPQAGRKSR